MFAHAALLTEARSCIAALADKARTIEAASAYDLALIELDGLHCDDAPGLFAVSPIAEREVLMAFATSAIGQLITFGVDPLDTELLLASLEDARALDEP